MHTLPDTVTPSIEDQLSDANVRSSAVIDIIEDCLDVDDWVSAMDFHFGYDQPMSDADLDECYAAEMAARNAPAAKWAPFELEAPATVDTIVRLPDPAAWGPRKAVSL